LTVLESVGEAPVVEPVLKELNVKVGDLSPTTADFLSRGSNVGEGLRAVATRLRIGEKGRQLHTFAVVSSIQGEGKTSVALGLAAAFARAGRKVLLIDADLRRRDACELLGIEPDLGLAEWLESGLKVLPVMRVAPAGFYLLGAGRAPCRPELLGSSRVPGLLSAAERSFDPVILDCAPVLPVADSLALRDRMGGFILVVRMRQTPREAVIRAASLLHQDKIVGMVLNAESGRRSRRRTYQYGYGYKSSRYSDSE
jgi:capsular exopolysaccharide synthesis family protein